MKKIVLYEKSYISARNITTSNIIGCEVNNERFFVATDDTGEYYIINPGIYVCNFNVYESIGELIRDFDNLYVFDSTSELYKWLHDGKFE